MLRLGTVIGLDRPNKPFPHIVHFYSHLFVNVRTILDIGAGRGRFVKYFLIHEYRSSSYVFRAPVRFNVRKYIAIEPCMLFCTKHLRAIASRDHRLEVICARWEDVRSIFVNKKFDMIILWDVLMFIQLDPYKVLEELIDMCRMYFLFSLHPVKYSFIPSSEFRQILSWLDSHPKLLLIAKTYLNRVYAVR